MNLTEEIILQHGRQSPYKGKMKNPTLKGEMDNPLCGDSLKIYIKLEQGKVIDICFSGEGCLISQAAASLLIGEVKKVKDLKKIKGLNEDVVLTLLGIPLTPSRLQCALLSLKTLKKAVNGVL
ncbi:iron-sulfur cluster assembly scaffold protein [Candidatus Daviesbacteria bacterium]|nr:iron-sulfur cluster assembly scaffold protein [Candidatus Daviesbacteria bacterium]